MASLIAGCEAEPESPSSLPPIVVPVPSVAPPVWDARGSLVSDEPLADVRPELAAEMGEGRHALYRSVSGINGAGTEVSGAFFIPKGDPPPGGWPVISFAHGTTGLNTDCAPSADVNLRGYAPAVRSLLSIGYAVAFTDYQGLGSPGLHPFLEPRTAGFNVIDAVRALRALYPDVSTRWVAYGNSQGGQASWAANELNKFYGGGLDLLGSVALAPAADVSALGDLAFRGALSTEQRMVMPLIVVGVQRSAPAVAIDHLLHGETLAAREVLIGCAPDALQIRAKVVKSAEVKPTSGSDAAALTTSLRKMALPREPLSASMLVVYGEKDALVLPEWVRTAVDRSCRLGGHIELRGLADKGHSEVVPDGQAMTWIGDRFANEPAPSNCTAA